MKRSKQSTLTPSELLGNLQALVVEAEQLTADSISEHSAEAFRNLRARFDVARDRFAEAYAGARIKVAAGAKYTDETIRANPYQALAIAAGIGLLVGMCTGRRND